MIAIPFSRGSSPTQGLNLGLLLLLHCRQTLYRLSYQGSPSSGSLSNSSSLAVPIASVVTSSIEVLNPSESFLRVGINSSQIVTNIDSLASSHESHLFFMSFGVANPFQEVFNGLCPDPSVGSLSVAAQSCLTLCDSLACSPPGSSVHGDHQARILEWVTMPSPRGSSQPSGIEPRSPANGGFFTVWATREAWQL